VDYETSDASSLRISNIISSNKKQESIETTKADKTSDNEGELATAIISKKKLDTFEIPGRATHASEPRDI